jgi:hypothetical protein
MGIRSSPQETKANIGGKRQIDSLQQILQESSQAGYGTQCDEIRSLQTSGKGTVRRCRTGLVKKSATFKGHCRLSMRHSVTIFVHKEKLGERQKN